MQRGEEDPAVCHSPPEIPHTWGERSSLCHFRHRREMRNDAVEELLLSDRGEINGPDACTPEGNNP